MNTYPNHYGNQPAFPSAHAEEYMPQDPQLNAAATNVMAAVKAARHILMTNKVQNFNADHITQVAKMIMSEYDNYKDED